MSQFDAEKFMLEPNQDIFSKLRKDELILLAKHLNLEVKNAMRKHDIQDAILRHLVSDVVFEEIVLENYEASKPKLSPEQQYQLELKKLEMKERMEEKKKGTTRKNARKGKTRKDGRKGTTRKVRKRENGIAT